MSKTASKTRANRVSPALLTPAAASRLRPARGQHALTFGPRAKTNIFGNARKIELSSLVQSVKTFLLRANELKHSNFFNLTYREVSEPVLPAARSRIKSRPWSLLKEFGSHRGYFNSTCRQDTSRFIRIKQN